MIGQIGWPHDQPGPVKELFDEIKQARAINDLDALALGFHLGSGHGNKQDGKDVGDFRFSGFFNYLF